MNIFLVCYLVVSLIVLIILCFFASVFYSRELPMTKIIVLTIFSPITLIAGIVYIMTMRSLFKK